MWHFSFQNIESATLARSSISHVMYQPYVVVIISSLPPSLASNFLFLTQGSLETKAQADATTDWAIALWNTDVLRGGSVKCSDLRNPCAKLKTFLWLYSHLEIGRSTWYCDYLHQGDVRFTYHHRAPTLFHLLTPMYTLCASSTASWWDKSLCRECRDCSPRTDSATKSCMLFTSVTPLTPHVVMWITYHTKTKISPKEFEDAGGCSNRAQSRLYNASQCRRPLRLVNAIDPGHLSTSPDILYVVKYAVTIWCFGWCSPRFPLYAIKLVPLYVIASQKNYHA